MTTTSPTLPRSILLKRGSVQWTAHDNDSNNNNNNDSSDASNVAPLEAHVLILTHGLLVVTTESTASRSSNPLWRAAHDRHTASRLVVQRAVPWPAVHHVGPEPTNPQRAWRVVLAAKAPGGHPQYWTFTCPNAVQTTAWRYAVGHVLLQHYLHSGKAPTALGWQYRRIHQPAFTLAVQGYDDGLPLPSMDYDDDDDLLNALDEYNEYAPLHYAVRCNQLEAAQTLLEAGASIDTKDGDGHTAMFYSLRDDGSDEMTDLLHAFGAVKDKKKNKEWKAAEELFRRAQAADETTAQKRREQVEREKAETAQSEMANNLRLMQERGQKIEELDDKARHLNHEAQNFADMAKQLKEKTKKGARGSKWLPF